MAFGSCKQWNLAAPVAVLEGREAPQKIFIMLAHRVPTRKGFEPMCRYSQ